MNATRHAVSVPPLPALSPRARRIVARTVLALLIALPCIAWAMPPSWAPAHGSRRSDRAEVGAETG